MEPDIVFVDRKFKLPDNVFDSSRIPPGLVKPETVAEAQFMAKLNLQVGYTYKSKDGSKTRQVLRLFYPRNVFIEGVSEILQEYPDQGIIIFKTIEASPNGCQINYVDQDGNQHACKPQEFAEFLGVEGQARGKPPVKEKVVIPKGLEGQAAIANARLREKHAKGEVKIFREIDKMDALQ